MPTITVRDTIRLALPLGTAVVAGSAGLAHQVTWVAAQRATPPVFVSLRGGELALVSVAAAQAIDEQLTLPTLIERLARVPVAAIGAIGPIADGAREAAESVRIPLLHLPDETSLGDVEREVQRLLGDYEAQIDRRAAQFANALTQRMLVGAGITGLIDLLVERTGQAVGYYSLAGEARTLRGRGPARGALQTLRPTSPGLTTQLGQTVWVQMLGAGNERFGFLAIAGANLDDWDRLATQQAGNVIALELSKEQAVLAAEERMRGDFVQAVLMGPPGDMEALVRRGMDLGYDLRLPHAALLCSVGGADEASAARAANVLSSSLAILGVAAPSMRRDDGALCYLPINDHGPRLHEVAERLRARVAGEVPTVVLALGKEAPTITAWPRSLREAEQALLLGRQLLDTDHVLDFGDLGVYRLLLLLRETPELWEFYRGTLAALVDYDERQDAELLKTLDAFFASLGNMARTAEVLHVHRNTLLYRLRRIHEISGLDLDDPEERLALWLALKAHRILRVIDETRFEM